MSLKLTQVLSGGDLSEDVPEIRIHRTMHDSVRGVIRLHFGYGKTEVDGTWVDLPSPSGASTVLSLSGDDYVAFVSENAPVYQQVKAALYAELRAKELVPQGTVV